MPLTEKLLPVRSVRYSPKCQKSEMVPGEFPSRLRRRRKLWEATTVFFEGAHAAHSITTFRPFDSRTTWSRRRALCFWRRLAPSPGVHSAKPQVLFSARCVAFMQHATGGQSTTCECNAVASRRRSFKPLCSSALCVRMAGPRSARIPRSGAHLRVLWVLWVLWVF